MHPLPLARAAMSVKERLRLQAGEALAPVRKLLCGHPSLEEAVADESASFRKALGRAADDAERARRREQRRRRLEKLWVKPNADQTQRRLAVEGADCLLIAGHVEPTHTLRAVWPLVKPGASFAVFCEVVEPLVSLMHDMQTAGDAVRLQISSSWCREYQVLPQRTHPEMTMNADGGFVLSGVKLADPAPRRRKAAEVDDRKGRKRMRR